jgi:hypothetical protein
MARTHESADHQKSAVEPVRVERGHDLAATDGADSTAANVAGPSYIELSGKAYSFLVDALGAASLRRLAYVKSLYEVVARPYASTALEQTVRENFDRANALLALSIAEAQTSVQKSAEFSETWLEHAAKLQGSAIEASRGLVKSGLANLEFARDSSNAQFETFAKQVEGAQSRIAAGL